MGHDIPGTHTPFEQPWWLEAVAPGRWGAVEVERDGELVARLPYVLKRRFGVTVLAQAPLTRFLGPWIRPFEGKYATQLGREKEYMSELIAGLPHHDGYQACFAPEVGNWLPFYWANFDATVQYTYRLSDLSDPDALWAGLDKNIRSQIRRAQHELEVRTDLGLDQMLDLYRKTLFRHGKSVSSVDDIRRLDQACASRKARSIVSAVDAKGRVHAASFVVHGATTSYLLFSGADPDLNVRGATSLVRWEAILGAAAVTRQFDFLGSMLEPIERVNRGFGAQQVPYFFVSRARPHVKMLVAAGRAVESRFQARRARSAGTDDGG